MNCQARACDQPATPAPTDVDNRRVHLCELHATAAAVWAILTAPDTDPRRHVRRGCALPDCTQPRRIGRAICDHHAEGIAP